MIEKDSENTETTTLPSKNNDPQPQFGRLLIVLALAVLLISIITWASEAYWS